MITHHLEAAHQRLRTFLDVKCDEEVPLFPVIIVVHGTGHLRVAKAV